MDTKNKGLRALEINANASRNHPENAHYSNALNGSFSLIPFNQRLMGLFDLLGIPLTMAGYRDMGERLSTVANKSPEWSARYINSLATGAIKPGAKVLRAVEILEATLDGAKAELASARSERVLVSDRAQVVAGAYTFTSSRYCPECGLAFVPNHPARKYCPICRPPRWAQP